MLSWTFDPQNITRRTRDKQLAEGVKRSILAIERKTRQGGFYSALPPRESRTTGPSPKVPTCTLQSEYTKLLTCLVTVVDHEKYFK
ncbi:hypothetical protein Poly21_11190 [Allorhodopirellula heiligendammensis]|uniref:Uncharacterized protein n=1 Tax=Allorhodopirellula heiligendammensis TaxID=2714739 RepID=A0A5C6C445_9BACT|nr:hypothetical protein Poly21_11190 [Allorhodopirellula heiligendammensis]